MLKFAIVGCGLIGKKRQAGLPKDAVRVACDLVLDRAQALAALSSGCRATSNPEEAFAHPEVEAVVIATLNRDLAPLAKQALLAGKHVLVEKPGGLKAAELRELKALADAKNLKVRIGYNHRYHPALQKAHALLREGALGPLMFIRGRYGHGGRVGYDLEWRADAKLSGGGELIDQGVHLIDLAQWFMGDFPKVEGHASTLFWKMPVDDNAFMSLRTAEGQTAWLQVSCTEWKNLFSFEIYGKNAKLHLEGLGGSYGVERLAYYKMLPEMGPPETTIWEYPRGDDSWKIEMREFERDIRENRAVDAGLEMGIKTLEIVEKIYQRSTL